MRRVTTNVALVSAGDVGARFLGFLAVIHIARVLEPEYFGIITIGISILSYALLLSDPGLRILGTREIAKPYNNRSIQFGDVLLLRFVLAAVVFLFGQIAAGIGIQDQVLKNVVRIYLFCLFAEAVLLDWYYKGIQDFVPVAIARLAAGIIYVAGLYAFVRSAEDIYFVPIFYTLGFLIVAPFLFRWKKSEDKLLPTEHLKQNAMPVLRQSITIGAGGMFAQIVLYLPPIVIGILSTVTDAGIFGVAFRIILFALVMDRVFNALYLPYVSRQWIENPGKLQESIIHIMRWLIFAGFLVSLIFAVFAQQIIEILFGDTYLDAGNILTLLSLYIGFTLINSIFTSGLIAIGKEKYYLRAAFTGSIFAVTSIILLTYWFGIAGTAAAVVISECVILLLLHRKFNEAIQVPIFLPVVKILIIFAGIFGIFRYLDWQEIYYIPLAAVLYLLLSFAFGIIKR